MRPVERVEVHRTGPRVELLVGDDRAAVVRHHAPVVAAQHVQMRGHVLKMAGVGHQAAQPVRDGQGGLGGGRHLHEVDVQVQDPGVLLARLRGERPLQDGLGLHRAGALGRFAGPQIPQLPGREVHQRVGVERGDIEVVGGEFVHAAHAVRVGLVPHRAVLDGFRPRVASPQRADQGLFDGGGAVRLLLGEPHGGVGTVDGTGQVRAVEELPGLVVVRAQGVGDAPVSHGAVGIRRCGGLEAGDGFLVVEGVRPDQPAVEPRLGNGGRTSSRGGGGCRDRSSPSCSP